MRPPGSLLTADMTVAEVDDVFRRGSASLLLVGSPAMLHGVASRRDVDAGLSHGLGEAPISAVMGRPPPTASSSATLVELAELLSSARADCVAVEVDGEIRGVVSAGDVPQDGIGDAGDGSDAPERSLQVLNTITDLQPLLDAIDAMAGDHGRPFLVGGVVRDALLGVDVVDIDLTVEGSGVEFAEALARRLGGRASRHDAFGTATVSFGEQTIDVATTRSEAYAAPAALPSVADATIEQDLYRRDFTVNAMAMALGATERWTLLDPYGGETDLASRTLRVIHSLSFIDDPTRLIRAARYEARYGFALDPHSDSLARSCVALRVVEKLSGARVGNELVPLLKESAGAEALERLHERGVVAALHPALDAGASTLQAMRHVESLAADVPDASVWRIRLALLTGSMSQGERVPWLRSLQLARADVQLIDRASEASQTLLALVGRDMSSSELHKALAPEPIEATVLALGAAAATSTAELALRRFVADLRHVELTIGGDDLATLGLPRSPEVGRVLEAVLALKLDGRVATRGEELDAAAGLIEQMKRR